MDEEVLDWIDTDRYPINDPDSGALASVITAARTQIAEMGAAELPGFIRQDALAAFVADAEVLSGRAHPSGGLGTAYLELPDEERFSEDHPRRTWMPYAVRAVAYDLIPTTSPLRKIYESEPVRTFLESVLNRGTLHRYADPFGALNLAVMGEGDALQWHFDQTDFVVSLAIQTAESGGDFEVVPKIRTTEDERYDDVASVLAGNSSRVLTLAMTPGTLLVFEGRHSIHRVTPIVGDRLRHVGLLGYDTREDVMSSELLRLIRYGRSEPFEEPPMHWEAS